MRLYTNQNEVSSCWIPTNTQSTILIIHREGWFPIVLFLSWCIYDCLVSWALFAIELWKLVIWVKKSCRFQIWQSICSQSIFCRPSVGLQPRVLEKPQPLFSSTENFEQYRFQWFGSHYQSFRFHLIWSWNGVGNGIEMELKWSQNGAEVGACEDAHLFFLLDLDPQLFIQIMAGDTMVSLLHNLHNQEAFLHT